MERKLMAKSRALALTCSLCALSTSVATYAQTPSRPESEQADATYSAEPSDIVVTAQRREERLQDVPIAITALGNEQLSERGAVDLAGLAGAVPGLSISGFTGANASNVISIRGVTGQVLAIGAGQATAVYIDGVYLSRPDAAFFGLDDVERLEVLRGPQGTLYGRNATAGAINIITRTPSREWRGGGEVSYGNFETVAARGSISGPIGGGLAFGLSGSFNKHDGYIRNTVTGNKLADRNAFTLRGKLRYATDDDAFSAEVAGDYTRDRATPVFKNGVVGGVFVGMGNPEEFSTDVGTEALTDRLTKSRGVSLTLNYEASDALDLVSITGWRKINITSIYDADGSAAPAAVAGADNESKTFNQEVRGVFSSGPFRATVGGNYFTEDANFGLSVTPPTAVPYFRNPFDTSDLTAWALFTQLEFDITSRLTLVGGLRYNNEKRDFAIDYRGALPTAGPLFTGRVSDEAFIPSFGVNYKLDPDVLLYAKVSKGYQAPGFNFAPGAAATKSPTFGPETLWAYELGIKSQFFDRRVTFNAAVFNYDYSDIQIRSTIGVGLTEVQNAASARLRGAEASLNVNAGSGISFAGHVTYLDAKYRDFCQAISGGDPQVNDPICAPGRADRSGNRLNLAPKWSGGVSVNYEGQIGNAGKLSANASYDFSSSVFYLSNANEPGVESGDWGILNGRIGFEIDGGPEVFVYGRNLTDKRFIAFTSRVSAGSVPVVMNEPRTYGVGLRYHF